MNKYEKQAIEFLRNAKATMEIKYKGKAINPDWKDDTERNYYSFEIRTQKGTMSGTFWDSIHNTQRNNKPTEYDILACLTKYDPGTFEEFCSDYGYDEDSRTAEKIYIAVVREYKQLERIFTTEQLEELAEIN